ncbi:MAG: hypothetical protein CM15mP112_00100 [Flavobacteriales bacterium]|nr:MAG: hypothetical protein CM15mP112_00100 [Flavobacteriales bacterium]
MSVRFNFTPTKDTYQTIFALWDDEVYLLFPNEEEKKYERRDGSTFFKKNKNMSLEIILEFGLMLKIKVLDIG